MFAFSRARARGARGFALALAAALALGCDALPAELSGRLAALGLGAAPAADSSTGQSLGPDSAQRLYYQFIDERGQVRFVERLADVPEAWRDRVGFVELAAPPPLSPGDARRSREARHASASPARRAPSVVLYSADWCGWCRKAKAYLDRKGVAYEVRDVDNPAVMAELVEKTGQRGIPVFDVDGRILTGFDPAGVDRLL